MGVVCPRHKKLALAEFEAHNMMEGLRPTDPRQDLLEVYRCDGGDLGEHFHVGHADPGGGRKPSPRRLARTVEPTLTHTLGEHFPPHLLALAGSTA